MAFVVFGGLLFFLQKAAEGIVFPLATEELLAAWAGYWGHQLEQPGAAKISLSDRRART